MTSTATRSKGLTGAIRAALYGWFVWDRTHTGPTELRRISWENPP